MWRRLWPALLLLLVPLLLLASSALGACTDAEAACFGWVAENASSRCFSDDVVAASCARSCRLCGEPLDPKFELSRLPLPLAPLAFLVGIWRSEFGGKAFFPTIPRFTYGEQIEFSISDEKAGRMPSLNYTAFAWDPNDMVETHSESGYVIMGGESEDGVTIAELTTAMSNGFMTVEVGEVGTNQVRFQLERIGRISFSHDSAVRTMYRDWTLLDPDHLEARLQMTTTVTRKIMEHTAVVYRRILP